VRLAIYSTERNAEGARGQIPAEDKQAIEAAMTEAREAFKSEDLERIKRAQEELNESLPQSWLEVMYREAQAQPVEPSRDQTGRRAQRAQRVM